MKRNDVLPEPLTTEEESKILKQIADGDEEARNILISHNLRLVYYIAGKFKNTMSDLEDLASIGSIGLIKAVKSFKIDKKIKFSTYATRCIENEILMVLRKEKKRKDERSLEYVVHRDEEGNEMNLLDFMGTERDEIEKNMIHKENTDTLWVVLDNLDDKEKQLIESRYGINRKKKSQMELADDLKISQSYVSRYEKKILQKMNSNWRKAIG